MESIGKKIIKNTIYNSIGRIWLMLVTLLLIPYVLHKLGVQVFAVWSLVFVVANYLGVLDFGIRTSFAKYIAEYHTQKDQDSINAVINCGIIFYLAFSLFITGVAVVLRGPIISLLQIPSSVHKESMFAILGMVSIFSVSNTFSIFEAVLVGLQRMDVQNKIMIFASVFNIAGTFFFLEKGLGIKGLVINYGIVSFVILVLNIHFSYRLLPQIRIGLSWMDRKIFRRLFNYGIKMQICNLALLVHFQTDKIIISYFLGLNFVTFYELGQKAASAMKMIPLLMLSALVPAVSELEVLGGNEKLKDLYRRGSKFISVLIFPLLFVTLIAAPQLIRLWVGEGYNLSVLTFQILGIEYSLNVLTGMGTSIVRGIGRPEYEARYAVVVTLLQLVLSIVLIQLVGYKGVLISLLVSGIIGSSYFLISFHKLFQENLVGFIKQIYLKPLMSSAVAFLVALISSFCLGKLLVFDTKLQYLVVLIINLIVFFGLFLFLIVKSRYLDTTDIRLFKIYRERF